MNTKELVQKTKRVKTLLEGGAGSGNFGHAGRAGEVGGSSGDGGGGKTTPHGQLQSILKDLQGPNSDYVAVEAGLSKMSKIVTGQSDPTLVKIQGILKDLQGPNADYASVESGLEKIGNLLKSRGKDSGSLKAAGFKSMGANTSSFKKTSLVIPRGPRGVLGIMFSKGKHEAFHALALSILKEGGPGSGNFGHAGRAGEVGGSGEGGGMGAPVSPPSPSAGSVSSQEFEKMGIHLTPEEASQVAGKENDGRYDYQETPGLLPTGSGVNFSNMERNEYVAGWHMSTYDSATRTYGALHDTSAEQSYHFLKKKGGPTVVVASSGPSPVYKIGRLLVPRHDQTQARMGTYRHVGTLTGKQIRDNPSLAKKLAGGQGSARLWVFK
jgi:hypothetical protein